MSEWTSIPAASGLTTVSVDEEAGTGTGIDLAGGSLGRVGSLGWLDFLCRRGAFGFGSSCGTDRDASGSRMGVVKRQGAASQEGYRDV
jgi:hypothetical protein